MKFEVSVKKIIQETPNAKSFIFDKPKGLDFNPGQSFSIYFLQDHGELRGVPRSFTPSTSPTFDHMELTVKKETVFTTEILNNFKVGEKLGLHGPFGKIAFTEDIKDDLILIAGGSGITPMMSIIRYVVDKKLPNKITLLYSNKTEEDIIYKKELEDLEKKGKLKVVYCITREKNPGIKCYTKRIESEIITESTDLLKEKTFFVCGPPQMVSSLTDMLRTLKVPDKKIIYEK